MAKLFTGFTKPEARAIRQTLIDAPLKPEADWPRIFSEITVLMSDVCEGGGASAPGAKTYESTEKKKLKALSKKLDAVAQEYAQLGELLQWHVDDQCPIRNLTSNEEGEEEWAALVSKQTGQHHCPTPITDRLSFRQLLESLSSAVRLATEHPNPHAHVQKNGPPKNHAMHLIVTDLLAIFERDTGIVPIVSTSPTTESGYDGNFLPFAVACIAPLRLVPREYLGSSILSVYTQWLAQIEELSGPSLPPARKSKK